MYRPRSPGWRHLLIGIVASLIAGMLTTCPGPRNVRLDLQFEIAARPAVLNLRPGQANRGPRPLPYLSHDQHRRAWSIRPNSTSASRSARRERRFSPPPWTERPWRVLGLRLENSQRVPQTRNVVCLSAFRLAMAPCCSSNMSAWSRYGCG
jgi:hypothetical protein